MTSGFCRGLLTAISSKRITTAEVGFSRIQMEWDKGGPQAVHDYADFYGRGNCNRAFGISSFVHTKIRSTVKRVEFVTDILLRGPGYCVNVSTNFHIYVYSGNYSRMYNYCYLGKENISKSTNANDNLHEINMIIEL
jgi:hypothetical protein